MFAFLKKLIAGKESETKFNAVESMMDIDGEQVSVKDLIDTYKAEQAEIEEKKKLEAAQFEEVSMDNEVADSEGNKYKIGDLIESHRNRTAAKKNAAEDEERAKKEKADKEAKEKENSKCNCDAKDGKHNAECPAKEKEKENAEETDEEKELKIKKQNEKDEAEKKEKEEADKKAKENAKGDKLRFFKKINTLRDEAEGKKEVAVRSIGTMSDRLARGKAKFGAKNKAAKK